MSCSQSGLVFLMFVNCCIYVLQLQLLMVSDATLVHVNAVHYSHHQPLPGTVALIILTDYSTTLEDPVKCAVNVKVHEISTLLIAPLQLQAMVLT